MKEIKSLTLVLENCEQILVERKYIGNFLLDNYVKTYSRNALNSISGNEIYETLVLQIHPNINESKQEGMYTFLKEAVELPINRLKQFNDITQIMLTFEDDSTEIYFFYWSDDSEDNSNQKSYLNEKTGELFIVIDKDKNIADYFDKYELNLESLEDGMWELWEE